MASFKMLIDVGLNAAGVQVGLQRMTNSLSGWASRTAGSLQGRFAAAFGASAILEASRRAIEYADNLEAMSTRLGVSTDSLQEFAYAAKLGNAEMTDFQAAIEKINETRLDALADPDGKAAGAYKGLGISQTDLKRMRADDILKKAGGLFQTGDPQALVPLLREIAGRGAGKLAPAMAEGLDSAAESARRLGIVIDQGTIQSLAVLSDEMDIVAMELRGQFIPALRFVVEGLMRLYYMARGRGSTVGNAAAFLGALSGGSSIKEANEIRKEVTSDADTFVDRMTAEIQAKMKKREEIMNRFRDTTFAPPAEKDDEKKSKESKQGESLGGAFSIRTQNQRIGAFINPIAFAVEKEQVTVLKSIDKNIKDLPRKLNSGSGDIYAGT